MNREERVRAVICGQEADRIPVSVWMHLSEYDQDPRSLAETMVDFNEKYDYDFIKMMPFGAYTVSDWGAKLAIFCDKYKEVEIAAPTITELEDYKAIRPLPPIYGTWGKTLQLSQWLSKLARANTPYIQTLFTPATTLRKMTGPRLLQDMREHPEYVHEALEAITETTINFAQANIEAGVSGFFLATQCATYDFIVTSRSTGSAGRSDPYFRQTSNRSAPLASTGVRTAGLYSDPLMTSPFSLSRWARSPSATTMKRSPSVFVSPGTTYAPIAPAPTSATESIFICLVAYLPASEHKVRSSKMNFLGMFSLSMVITSQACPPYRSA